MIRNICSYCHRVLGYQISVKIGKNRDSGDICPRCVYVNTPDFYWVQKWSGNFTAEQIAEAETCAPPSLPHLLARDLGLLGQATYCFFGSLWLMLKLKIKAQFTTAQS